MKRLAIKILSIMILCSICTIGVSYATNYGNPSVDSFDEIKSKADAFIEHGKNQKEVIGAKSLKDMIIPVAQTMVAIATVVVSVVTVIMGIKYLMASPDEKGKLKQQLIGLVVSTIVIFGAQGIWALVYNFMTSITK